MEKDVPLQCSTFEMGGLTAHIFALAVFFLPLTNRYSVSYPRVEC